MTTPSLCIWCITDQKPGHRSQLEGLVNALSSETGTNIHWISVNEPLPSKNEAAQQRPDLILAAGHRTHLKALRIKWRHGGILVVLMKPSLPLFLFDLCVIPEHDGVPDSKSVVTTQGALNPIPLSDSLNPNKGLILIGGPSKHHGWSDTEIVDQITELIQLYPGITWTLTTSRRTPESILNELKPLAANGLQIVPVEQTDKAWLIRHYEQSGIIWVSEDSVSMVYESLSTGAQVGVLEVPRKQTSRVSLGLDQLVAQGRLMTLDNQKTEGKMPATLDTLREADRVAQLILERFFQNK